MRGLSPRWVNYFVPLPSKRGSVLSPKANVTYQENNNCFKEVPNNHSLGNKARTSKLTLIMEEYQLQLQLQPHINPAQVHAFPTFKGCRLIRGLSQNHFVPLKSFLRNFSVWCPKDQRINFRAHSC